MKPNVKNLLPDCLEVRDISSISGSNNSYSSSKFRNDYFLLKTTFLIAFLFTCFFSFSQSEYQVKDTTAIDARIEDSISTDNIKMCLAKMMSLKTSMK